MIHLVDDRGRRLTFARRGKVGGGSNLGNLTSPRTGGGLSRRFFFGIGSSGRVSIARARHSDGRSKNDESDQCIGEHPGIRMSYPGFLRSVGLEYFSSRMAMGGGSKLWSSSTPDRWGGATHLYANFRNLFLGSPALCRWARRVSSARQWFRTVRKRRRLVGENRREIQVGGVGPMRSEAKA